MTTPGSIIPRSSIGGASFIERGEGEAIVLIHGEGLSAEAWEAQLEAFAASSSQQASA